MWALMDCFFMKQRLAPCAHALAVPFYFCHFFLPTCPE